MIESSDAHRLEIAQDVLGCLIALRSESIFYERKKAQPNVEIISQWKAERYTPFDLTRSLNCDDPDTIENVIATYGPYARALFDSGKQPEQVALRSGYQGACEVIHSSLADMCSTSLDATLNLNRAEWSVWQVLNRE